MNNDKWLKEIWRDRREREKEKEREREMEKTSQYIFWFCSRVTRLGNFLPNGLRLEACCTFLQRQGSQNKWWHFGLLFASANFVHFHLNRQFLNKLCGRLHQWFKVHALDFKIELWCRYLFIFGDYFGHFSKILGSLLVTLFWSWIQQATIRE